MRIMPHGDAGWYQRHFAMLLTEPRGTRQVSSAQECWPDYQDHNFGLSTESPSINRFLTNLQSKRLRMVAHAYPATVRVASDAYGNARLAEMFWVDQPPQHMHPSTAYIQNIDMWSTFIQKGPFVVRLPWITDLANFERFRCKLILRAEGESAGVEGRGSDEAPLSGRYQISPLCDICSFHYDVIAIAAHFLRAGTLKSMPSDLAAPKDVNLVIQCSPPPGGPVPRTYQVSVRVARIIRAFANAKTIAEVLEENPAGSPLADRDRDIRAISQMAARGVISPVPVPS